MSIVPTAACVTRPSWGGGGPASSARRGCWQSWPAAPRTRSDPQAYQADLRCYGADAILGAAEPETATSHEVAAILKVCSPDQATATAIAKLANPLMPHMRLPAMSHLPSFAFMTSPAEI
jgi:hypothetical protein